MLNFGAAAQAEQVWTGPDKMESLVAGATRAAQRLGFDPRTVMTMVGVAHLASPAFLIEVEALAMAG